MQATIVTIVQQISQYDFSRLYDTVMDEAAVRIARKIIELEKQNDKKETECHLIMT